MKRAAVRVAPRRTVRHAVLAALTLMAAPFAALASTVSVPAVITVDQGQTVPIPVTIDLADGIEGADLRITYDPNVLTPAGDAAITALTSSCTPLTNIAMSGLVQIGLACTMALSGSGVLLTLPMTGKAPGSSALDFTRCDLNEGAIACTPAGGTVIVPTPTPTRTASITLTPSITPTSTPTVTVTRTLTATNTPPRTATRTATLPPSVHLDPISSPIVVGASNTLTGSGFTAGSRVLLFVNNGAVLTFGPYVPTSWTPTTLVWAVPATVLLGNGFGSVLVVNTDQGFIQSEARSQYLRGAPTANIPTILTINGVGLRPLDETVPVASVETVVAPGTVVTIGGSGFNAPLVNLFTGVGFVGPLAPQAGGTSSAIQVVVPANAATGPGTFQVVNSPFTGNVVSNAVSVVLGARLDITAISQSGSTVIVDGAGFSALSVINLWNRQGAGSAYFGGYNAQGQPNVPLTLVSSTRFTFGVPPGAISGVSYLQVVNPPFIPSSTTGADPDGAFIMTVP